MKLSDKAQVIYDKTLKPHLNHFEDFRINSLNEYNKRKAFAKKYALIIFISLALIEFIINDGDAFIVLVLGALAYFIYVYYPAHQFEKKFKEFVSTSFLPILFKDLFNFSYYNKEKRIDKNFLKESKLVSSFNRYDSEDYFIGNIDNINLEFAEIHLERKKSKTTVTTFKGGAIVLTMPFEFMSHTVVSLGGSIKASKDLNKVLLENPEFEKKYETYSNDQQAARYLMTPAFMQRTLDFSKFVIDNFGFTEEEMNEAKPIELPKPFKGVVDKINNMSVVEYEFKGNKMLILINIHNDMFSSGDINKSVYDISSIARIEQQIKFLMKIIEQLKLDYLTARKLSYGKVDSHK